MKNITPILLFFCSGVACAQPARLVHVGAGYSQTSVNTAVFRASSLTSIGDTQFVAFYDADEYVVLGKRNVNDTAWMLQRTACKGRCADAHNVIGIMADGDGYLHVAFDHHNNALKYCRSVAPHSLTLGGLEAMTGTDEQKVTYPEFYRLANGDLLFAYRSGESGRGSLVLKRYSTAARSWTTVHRVLVDGEEQRSAYWQLCVDAAGTLHLSWVWRETWNVETNHDLCYARSLDGGVTWHKSDGTRYALPITEANADVACRIPQGSELINQTGMSADAHGHPYIATYWRDADSRVPQYRLVWHDGSAWRVQQVGHRTSPFSLSGGGTKMIPIARPRVAIGMRDGHEEVLYLFRDAERGSKVSLARTSDLRSGRWEIRDLTSFAVGAWEPTFDTELWRDSGRMHIFVQPTAQGDGEQRVVQGATQVSVLELNF